MKFERRGDWAVDILPGHTDDTGSWVGESREGGWEEIEVVSPAARTLIDNLYIV